MINIEKSSPDDDKFSESQMKISFAVAAAGQVVIQQWRQNPQDRLVKTHKLVQLPQVEVGFATPGL